MPGRANVIAGQTGIFRTSGRTAEQMTLRFPAGAAGQPRRDAQEHLPRQAADDAHGHAPAWSATAFAQARTRASGGAKDEDKKPPRTSKLEALKPVARRQDAGATSAAHRADDLDTGLRLAKEFNLQAGARPGDGGAT